MIWLQAQGDGLSFLFPMIAILVAFYFLMIRPQQKEQQAKQQMQQSLSKGDKVVTAGGIHGSVAGVEEHVVTIEIANLKGDRIRMKVDRGKIERKVDGGSQASQASQDKS